MKLSLVVLLALLAPAAWAESLLLTGASVHTVSGPTLEPGQVLLREGKIAAVGSALASEGAHVLDLKGQHLYPGLILLNSILGLTELEAVRGTQDSGEVGDYTPDVESWVAVNPDSELIPVARANGIACFEPVPQGGIVAGQSGLLAVEGWTTEQMTLKKPLALHLFWPSAQLDTSLARPGQPKPKALEEQAKERRTRLQSMQEFFEEAKAYGQAKAAAAQGKASAPAVVPAWEAMLPYVQGRLPLVVHAEEVRQIRAAVAWAYTNHFTMILAGGRDAWQVAGLLASNQIPVIYSHVFTLPAHDSASYDTAFAAPARLQQAGVKVCFSIGLSAFETPMAANLAYGAAQAVAFGLPASEALKGLTLYPAQLAGVAQRLGSLEAGKDATLFAADGDILDIRSHVTHLWVGGREVSLQNRHTRLYQKYKNRPKDLN